MTDDYADLPDETPIDRIEMPKRPRNALKIVRRRPTDLR
jgi:hypothetical protein